MAKNTKEDILKNVKILWQEVYASNWSKVISGDRYVVLAYDSGALNAGEESIDLNENELIQRIEWLQKNDLDDSVELEAFYDMRKTIKELS